MSTQSKADEKSQKQQIEVVGTIILGAVLILAGIVFVALIFKLWPKMVTVGQSEQWQSSGRIFWGLIDISVSGDMCLILLVILSSALGSYIHIASSFAGRVGKGTFTLNWTWWYILRIFIGISLAILFYFVMRGGLLTTNASNQYVNPYGICGISGLVGLFSKQATEKLKEIFDTIFRTDSDNDEK